MKRPTVKQLAFIHKAFYVLAAFFAIASYLREVKGGPRPLLWLALAFVIISIVWRIIFVKCPGCGDSLSSTKTIPDICPCCGYDLTTNTPKENNNGETD